MSSAKKANIEVHDKEASFYEEVHTEIFNGFEQSSLDIRYRKAAKNCRERKTALDIGCGTGNLTNRLLGTFNYVVGLDISRGILKECKIRHKEGNFDCVLADAEHLPFHDNAFNFIGMYSVLHHLPSPSLCLEEIFRALKLSGIAYIDHEPNSRDRRKISQLINLFLFMAIQYKRMYAILSSVGLNLRGRYYSRTDVQVPKGFHESYFYLICEKIGFSNVQYCFHHNFSARFSQLPYPLDELSRLDNLLDRIPIFRRFSSLILLFLKK